MASRGPICFQLADAWSPAQAQAWESLGPANAFGLLRWNLSRRPAFLSLRNLLRAVNADSALVPSPGGLRYGLEGAGPDVRQMLLRSADGSFALVLWRQVSIWDRDALKDLHPAPQRVDVVPGQPIALARRFDPVDSGSERRRWTEPRRIPVDLAGAPVVLRLTRQDRPRRLGSRPACGSTSRGRGSASGCASAS